MINLDSMISFAINIIHEMGIGIVFLIAGLSFQRIRRRFYRRKFKYAFGFVVENGDKFAISIPLWTLKENRREVPRFVKITPWDRNREEYYGPTETFSADDMKSSREISAILAEIFPQPAQIIPDRDALQFREKTVLMIGSPVANFHARGIFQRDFFQMGSNRPFVFKIKDETMNSPSKTYVFSNQSEKKYYSNETYDIAVVQRLKNPSCNEGFLFIVAGSHAEGTFGASRYLRNNWEFFSRRKIGSTAGVLLKIDRSNPENIEVLERYPNDLEIE